MLEFVLFHERVEDSVLVARQKSISVLFLDLPPRSSEVRRHRARASVMCVSACMCALVCVHACVRVFVCL